MHDYLQSAIHCRVNFVDQIFRLRKVVELHWGQWQFSPAEDAVLYVRFLFRKKKRSRYVVTHHSFLPEAFPPPCFHRGNAVSWFCDAVAVPSVKWGHSTAACCVVSSGSWKWAGFCGLLDHAQHLAGSIPKSWWVWGLLALAHWCVEHGSWNI